MLKKDLTVVEDQLQVEAGLLSDFQDNYITLSDSQIQTRRNSIKKKIEAFDSLDFTTDQ